MAFSSDGLTKGTWYLNSLFPCQFGDLTNVVLFEAFLYGALILHGTEGVQDKHRETFKELMTDHPKEKIAFAINGCMKLLLGHVSKIAVVIYHDFSHWQQTYDIPNPNVFWHSKLFGDYAKDCWRLEE